MYRSVRYKSSIFFSISAFCMAFKVSETIQIKQGKLDFPHYRCTNCHAKWYDSGDVIALVVSYQLESPR